MISQDAEELSYTRSPLIHVLFPLMLGCTWASKEESFLNSKWSLILALVCFSISLLSCRFKASPLIWAIFFYSGIFVLSGYFVTSRTPEHLSRWDELPKREVELTLKVWKPFGTNDAFGRVSGVATVVDAPVHLADLKGQRVAYHLLPREKGLSFNATQVFFARGELLSAKNFDLNIENRGYYEYLEKMNVGFKLQRGLVLRLLDAGNPFFAFCDSANRHLSELLTLGIAKDNPSIGILPAIVFGKKSQLSDEQTELFVNSGTMHFFAVSGLNVALIAAAVYGVLSFFPLSVMVRAIMAIGLVYLYVVITGSSASAMRAFMMVAFFWSARFVARKPVAVSALISSAIVAILMEPTESSGAGFQLSYAVVLAILLYAVPLSQLWQDAWNPERFVPLTTRFHWLKIYGAVGRWLGNGCIVSVAAGLASAPLIVLFFGVVTPGSVVLNLVLFSIIGFILMAGMVSCMVGLVLPSLCAWINPPIVGLINLIQIFLDYALKIPGIYISHLKMDTNAGIAGCLLCLTVMALMTSPALESRKKLRVFAPIITGVLYLCVFTSAK